MILSIPCPSAYISKNVFSYVYIYIAIRYIFYIIKKKVQHFPKHKLYIISYQSYYNIVSFNITTRYQSVPFKV